MKICYLCPDLGIPIDGQKGASSHIRGFVKALKSEGHDIQILTPCPVKEGTLDVPVHVIPQPDCVEGILKEENPRAFRALRHVLYNSTIDRKLGEIIPNLKPDIVYERYSPFSIAGGGFAKRHGIPHFLEVNAPLAEQGKLYRKQALQEASELLEKSAFTQAGRIITLTNELKEWLLGLGIPESKVKVRPCGVDETLFNQKGPSYKEQFQGKIVLGFVGSLKPWHDISMLCQLFKQLAGDPRYHLLVVGDGPMRKSIEELSAALPGRVTRAGAVSQEEVPTYIRTMDIALAPYPKMDLFYFSPLKVYEYMAAGCPVIAAGIGQLNAIIKQNHNGVLAPPEDVGAWEQEIKKLTEDPLLRTRIGSAAAEEVRLHHTWTKRARAFIDIVEHYFNGSKPQRDGP